MFGRKPKNFSAMEQYLIRVDAERVEAKLGLVYTTGEIDSSVPRVLYDVYSHDGNLLQMEFDLKVYEHSRNIAVDKLVTCDRIRKRLFKLAETDFRNHVEILESTGIIVDSSVQTPEFAFLERSLKESAAA